jgi:hypothetical protein
MNTRKLWNKIIMASTLLALLFTAGCGMARTLEGPVDPSLVEQGNVFMTHVKEGDFQATYEMMSSDAQRALDEPLRIARGVVDMDEIIESVGSQIVTWEFDRSRIYTKSGVTRGALEGRIEYVFGKSGKVRLEFEQQEGTWKLRSSNLVTEN